MRVLSGLFPIVSLIASGWAAPASSEPLQSTSKWGVDFGEAHCIAYRSFDTPGKPLLLMVKAPVLGDDLQVSFRTLGKSGGNAGEQLHGTWQVNDGLHTKVTILQFHPDKSTSQILMMNFPRSALGPMMAKSAMMSLTVRGKLSHSVQIDGMSSVMKVMDECVAGLRKDWNVTGQTISNYAAYLAAPPGTKFPETTPVDGGTHAKSQVHRYFSSDDYPAQSLSNGDDGVVRAVLLINKQGRVADCTLTKTSGVAALDAQTCAVVRERARYKPARDPAGVARRDVDTFNVRWVL